MTDKDGRHSKSWWQTGFLSLPNVRDLVFLLLMVLVFWKLLNANINLQQFVFADFLSLCLALFAVALSAAFYFKATDTANEFYDRILKFTQDVSVILGRIEAGFGERLRHLDEGYTGLRDRVERLPFDVTAAKEQEELEKQEVKKKEEEYEALMDSLVERAQLDQREKAELKQRLGVVQAELESSRAELSELQHRIRDAEYEIDRSSRPPGKQVLEHIIWRQSASQLKELSSMSNENLLNASPQIIQNMRVRKVEREVLIDSGYIDYHWNLSPVGLLALRQVLKKYRST